MVITVIFTARKRSLEQGNVLQVFVCSQGRLPTGGLSSAGLHSGGTAYRDSAYVAVFIWGLCIQTHLLPELEKLVDRIILERFLVDICFFATRL